MALYSQQTNVTLLSNICFQNLSQITNNPYSFVIQGKMIIDVRDESAWHSLYTDVNIFAYVVTF